MRRRRRRIAVAAAALLLVPAVAAGAPVTLAANTDYNALSGVGRGLVGLTDSSDVNPDGSLSDSDQIGVDLLRDAGSPDLLAQPGLDLPSGPLGIPGIMLQAYQRAASTLAKSQPNCHLHWSLLASIGRIESQHAHGLVYANGDTVRPILGPVLDGGGFAAIADTDGGTLDGDNRWDRAVGAMQFIPSTWRKYASDGNGDRVSNPHNVFDAALAAGKFLCSGGLDLADPQQRAIAVFRYNHSDSYVRTVLIWADAYANGVTPLPSTPVPTIPPIQQGFAPPVDQPTEAPPADQPAGGGGGSSTPTTTTDTTTTTTSPTDPSCVPATTTSEPPSSTTTTSPTPTTPTCTTTMQTPHSTLPPPPPPHSNPPPPPSSPNGGNQASTTSSVTVTSEAPADSSTTSSSGSGTTSPLGP